MSKWLRVSKFALTATAAGFLACAVPADMAHAQLLPGLQNWLSGEDNSPQGAQSGRNGGGGFFFRRGQQQAHASQAEQPDQPDPFKVQWVTNPQPGYPTLLQQNIEMTQQTIFRYQEIVARGGWPRVPELALKPGSRGRELITLHQRLEISGDLFGQSVPDEYDDAVYRAVQRFQTRHGLPPTGVLDRATVDAMNVPAQVRLQQLQASLGRLQALAPKAKGRYVIVNIPAAQVEAVEGDHVVSRHTAVVGKIERPSPELQSKIMEINFNPYWHVPRSIIRKDLVPKARELQSKGMDFFQEYRMEVFDSAGRPLDKHSIDWYSDAVYSYNFRQRPWEENSLGFVKINFPNSHQVYMHDTPLKSLFGQDERFESSGCIRVHDVAELVAWILQDNPGWDINRIRQMQQTGEQASVKVRKPIPVMFVYISAWTTPDGIVQFRPDIYNKDVGPAPETASAY